MIAMIIDAKDMILGRVCTFAAKQILLGNKIDVINCEECIVTGNKNSILENYLKKLHRKAPTKGPYFYRRPDLLVKRTVRGMIPFKRSRGREAFKNIKCHIGNPENLKNQKPIIFEKASVERIHSADITKVKDICTAVGWRQ